VTDVANDSEWRAASGTFRSDADVVRRNQYLLLVGDFDTVTGPRHLVVRSRIGVDGLLLN
jgi:hypothetical protein